MKTSHFGNARSGYYAFIKHLEIKALERYHTW